MIKMERFGTIINMIVGIVLCLVLGIYVQYKNDGFTVLQIIHSFLSSLFISYTIGDLIPVKAIGDKVASAFGLKNDGLLQHLVSTFMIALIMVTSVSFFSVFVAVGFADFLFTAWWSNYPALLLIGYVTLIFCFPLAVKTAIRLTSEKA